MKIFNTFIFFIVLLFADCKTYYSVSSTEKQLYKINGNSSEDPISSFINNYLKPFRDSLSKDMNVVIGEAMGDFKKEKPSGSLGNLVVDAMYNAANNYKLPITNYDSNSKLITNNSHLLSGAITNPGGLRINQISKGKITVGKIFELLPFENELVIVEVKGDVFKKWMQLIADNEGWPTSNINFKVINDTVSFTNIDTFLYDCPDCLNLIYGYHFNNIAIDTNTYYVATNDYVANGGDNCSFLIPCKKYSTGKTIRELVIAYIISQKNIYPDDNKRIQFIK